MTIKEQSDAQDSTELQQLYEAQKEKIGLDFKQFITTTPKSLDHLLTLLQPLQVIEPDVQTLLLEEPDVKSGQPYSEKLIRYAITPHRIIETYNSIAVLLHRAQKEHYLPPHQSIILSPEGATVPNNHQKIPVSIIIQNIHERTMLPLLTSGALYTWILIITRSKPNIIRGYTSKPHENNILLYPLNTI